MTDDPADQGAWAELTDDLLALTDRIRSTYREVAEESGPSEDEVRAAFATLVGAWQQVAGSVGAALQDEEVRSHLKKAAGSLVKAIGVTLSELAPDDEGEGE